MRKILLPSFWHIKQNILILLYWWSLYRPEQLKKNHNCKTTENSLGLTFCSCWSTYPLIHNLYKKTCIIKLSLNCWAICFLKADVNPRPHDLAKIVLDWIRLNKNKSQLSSCVFAALQHFPCLAPSWSPIFPEWRTTLCFSLNYSVLSITHSLLHMLHNFQTFKFSK